MQIGFIGAGNMAQAIINGLITNEVVNKDDIIVNSRTVESLAAIKSKYGVSTTLQKKEVLRYSDVIILAVKPNQMAEVIEDIKAEMKIFDNDVIFVSIAAGVSISELERMFTSTDNHIEDVFGVADSNLKIVRTMPNMPANVCEGMTGVSINQNVKFSDIDKVLKIFGAVGKVDIVEEKLMDAVVAVSGSSPAYIYMIIDAMAEAAVAEGMKKDMAIKFAAQSVMGSAKMVLQTRKSPNELKEEVCSPGGTTIEAVKVLEKHKIDGIIIKAMEACIEKSKTLV